MCGIVGYSGAKNAVQVLLEGLSALEYRGYDSAGVSVFTEKGLQTVKAAGRLAVVAERLASHPAPGCCGMAIPAGRPLASLPTPTRIPMERHG